MASPIHLRPVQAIDERLIWEWVNDPLMLRHAFQTNEPIPWENHRRWFAETLAGNKRTQYIAQTATHAPVGQIRFEPNEGEPVVSVYLAAKFRGQGLAAEVIRLGTERFCREKAARRVVAWIKPENEASRRAFLKAGYGQAVLTEFEGHPAWRLEWAR